MTDFAEQAKILAREILRDEINDIKIEVAQAAQAAQQEKDAKIAFNHTPLNYQDTMSHFKRLAGQEIAAAIRGQIVFVHADTI